MEEEFCQIAAGKGVQPFQRRGAVGRIGFVLRYGRPILYAREEHAELVVVTEKVKEKHMKSALSELREMESISEISSVIREY